MLEINRKWLNGSFLGGYVRKNIGYIPSDGWHRKWTHKVGWNGSGDKIHLIAMTDGMISGEFTKGSFSLWLEENDMVFMSNEEVLEFIKVRAW